MDKMNKKESISLSKLSFKSGDINVGVIFPGYGYERVSYALPVAVNFQKVRTIPIHRFIKKNLFYKYTPIILNQNIDLLHTWNTIPISNKPFIVSFENELPRYLNTASKWQEKLGYKILSSKRCKGLFAISEVAAKLSKQRMNELGYPEIADKIQVFRGGLPLQPALSVTDKTSKKNNNEKKIKLIFIGGDAFPKGLAPTFEALEELVNENIPIELTIIGGIKSGNYVLKEHSPNPVLWQEKITNATWVKHHESLPNTEVMNLLNNSDLLIYTSYDESLGWAPIEAALLGVPSITTNVFALPELVLNEHTGLIIPLRLGKDNRWQGIWETGDRLKKEVDLANGTVKDGVKRAIFRLYNTPELLKAFSINTKKHMTRLYDSESAAAELSKIYKRALFL